MSTSATLSHNGCIRSGEWIGPDYRRLAIPSGFRYYHALLIREMPERVRAEAEAILRAHPRTRYIIAPKY